MKEEITSCSCYKSDLELISKWKEETNLINRAEVVRICVQYANAHGVFK